MGVYTGVVVRQGKIKPRRRYGVGYTYTVSQGPPANEFEADTQNPLKTG